MRTVAFKVCCTRSVEEAEMARAAGAAAVGLVSAMPSGPGVIDDATVAAVTEAMAGRIDTFLLTAETTASAVIDQIERLGPSVVQLVAAAPSAEIEVMRAAHPGLRYVAVIHVVGPESVDEAVEAAKTADELLLDSGRPDAAVPELGGTGRVHDWQWSAEIVRRVECPVWLAGGLHPKNVAEAIAAVEPHGVDLCSGLRPDRETYALDPDLLEEFAAEVRRASEALTSG